MSAHVFHCPVCKGSGEVPTDRREYETGFWVTEPCPVCDGDGAVCRDLYAYLLHDPDARDDDRHASPPLVLAFDDLPPF